jgi:hypothetical protein
MATKQASGGRRMADAGKIHVSLWLKPEEIATLDAARGQLHRTQFLSIHGLAAAEKILKKSGKGG